MTYWSSASLIWCGFGSLVLDVFGRGVSRSSSSMISWQRLMHSSQMYTPWPAMSLRTCSWLFPQKEHRYGTLGPLVLLVVVTCPVPPLFLRLLRLRLVHVRRVRDRRTLAADASGVMGLRDQGTALRRVDRVDDAIVLGVTGSHEVVPVGVLDHLVERLPGVAREDLVVRVHQVLPFLHLDHGVRGVAAEATGALVDHD